MPASRQSRYKDRYDKLLDDSLAIVQSRDFSTEELAQTAEDAFKRVPGAVMVPIERIEPNPDNPRQTMDEATIGTLAASIAERGLLQPLVLRRNADRPGYYVVIAGSRRLLAARIVHGDPDETVRTRVDQIPGIIKDVSDSDAFADALLENLARADLSRAETMDALLRLHKDYGWSGNLIAKRTGRSQGDVSELLGLAQDAELADLVRADKLRPSTATIIKRMPGDARAAMIAEVEAGRVPTAEQVKRRYQEATRPQGREPDRPERTLEASMIAPPESVSSGPGVSNSIPSAAPTIPVDDASHLSVRGRGVSNSIPPHPDALTEDMPPSRVTPTIRDVTTEHGTPMAVTPSIPEQIEAVGTLVAMVDAGTPAGQAVLTAVRRDLATVYDKLAAYVKRQEHE